MSSTRDKILGALRQSLDGGSAGPRHPDGPAIVDARISAHSRNLVPRRAQLPKDEMLALFVAKAEQAAAGIERLKPAEVPAALQRLLSAHNLPPQVAMSPDAVLDTYPWTAAGLLEIRRGAAQPGDAVSVTPAFAGIAETGTLMLWSAPGRPTTLNFLPETHVAVLRAADVVPALEDAWARLRSALESGQAPGAFPRTVNLITGPSRTADIEQELILGAHGPRRLHILLVEDEE